jgi:hypothetical protein
MKTRTITAFVIFTMMVCLASGAFAAAPKLTVGSATVAAGGTTTVDITADNATGITGAAFTLTYDTDKLSVTVTSDFFQTFAEMGFDANDGLDADGKVDGTYDSPLVQNGITTGMRIAAANATAADGTNKTLFTLNIKVSEDATEDDDPYDINITATNLNNPAAGYSAAGEDIDLLIEAKADGTFAPLLTATAAAANVTKGTITIGEDFTLGDPKPPFTGKPDLLDLLEAVRLYKLPAAQVDETVKSSMEFKACDVKAPKGAAIDLLDLLEMVNMYKAP